MIETRPSDFIPLEQFSLAWRWTDPAYSVLPHSSATAIRPLAPAKAAELASEGRSRCQPHRVAEFDMVVAADSDCADSVRDRLLALGVDPETEVVVSWDADTALLTSWRVLVDHWPDFCYPSSDDVSVWASGESWTLCYRHFQVFEFSRQVAAT